MDREERPTNPIDPFTQIAKVTVHLDDADHTAKFFELVAFLLKIKSSTQKKVVVTVHVED